MPGTTDVDLDVDTMVLRVLRDDGAGEFLRRRRDRADGRRQDEGDREDGSHCVDSPLRAGTLSRTCARHEDPRCSGRPSRSSHATGSGPRRRGGRSLTAIRARTDDGASATRALLGRVLATPLPPRIPPGKKLTQPRLQRLDPPPLLGAVGLGLLSPVLRLVQRRRSAAARDSEKQRGGRDSGGPACRSRSPGHRETSCRRWPSTRQPAPLSGNARRRRARWRSNAPYGRETR